MNEFIEKLIGRLEEVKEKHQPTVNGKTTMRDLEIYKMTIGYAEEIVNQLAEEYKGGWIPCSEKKPRMIDAVLVCEKDGFMTVAIRGQAGKFCDTYANVLDDVIAWMPLPEPYREE